MTVIAHLAIEPPRWAADVFRTSAEDEIPERETLRALLMPAVDFQTIRGGGDFVVFLNAVRPGDD